MCHTIRLEGDGIVTRGSGFNRLMRSHAITKVPQRRGLFRPRFPPAFVFFPISQLPNTADIITPPNAAIPSACRWSSAAPRHTVPRHVSRQTPPKVLACPSPQPCPHSPPPPSLIPPPMFRYLLPTPPSASSPLPDNSRLVSLRLLSLHRRPFHLIRATCLVSSLTPLPGCTPASSAPPLSTPTPCNASVLLRGGQPDTTGHWQTSSSFMRQTSFWRREQLTRSECRSEHWQLWRVWH